MNLFSIPPLISAILFLLMGVLIYLRSKRTAANIAFVFTCFVTFWWQFSWFILFNLNNQKLASYLVRIGYIGIIFIPITLFHFFIYFLGPNRRDKVLMASSYILGTIFVIFLISTNYFINGYYHYFWGFYPKAGILHPFYLLLLIMLTARATILLFVSLRAEKGSPHRYNQIKYVLLSLIFYIPASSDFIVNYGVEFYPLGFLLILLSLTTVAYAIVRHQLMDIEVLIKKSLVFAGMFAFAFGVFVGITLLVSQFIGGGSLVSLAVSSLIIIISLRPIETWLINSTDKFLFQKKYEYKQIIRTFIDEVITKLNLDEVIGSTLKLLDETLHPYTAGVFILNKVDDKYQLYSSLGLEDKNISFTSESRLVSFLKRSKNPAVIKQIDGIAGVNPAVASEMASLKAVLVLPLLLHDDLIGFISLGRKKSDEEYSKDDLDILQDLARTESIAVGNAQLLTEAAQAERRAAIGTMSAGINHEIGNPLNIMATKIQMFKLSRTKGLFKDMPGEEVLDQAEAVLDECLKQSKRISEITKKLSNFAKPSKEFKPQLVSIPQEIEETLAVIGHDLELEKIRIDKQFSSDLFNILADKQEIQQVFFNLIRNAGQAIEEEGCITICAFNNADSKVHIEIRDTGKGIPDDKISRVFEPFFTTKGPNKGTGLGLSIVRQLVWKNKGEISFRSQVGIGTTFILEFPKGEQL